jgi:hypothetical protein
MAYLHEGLIYIRLVFFFKKAKMFCYYERANLMRNRPLKSDV